MIMKLNRFAIYSWFVVVYNICIILWGAYVRATGSGAGCGSHWPLCNGEVFPRSPQIETVIEFAHRFTSGIALILVLLMLIFAFRNYPKGNLVRKGAVLSMVFIIIEALVGAGLVLFEWVADDASSGRVISIALHLINTFILLSFLTLTAWWASTESKMYFVGRKFLASVFILGFLGVILIGVTGAITALGDTLFPSQSIFEGIQAEFSNTAHFLIRLRIWHPIIAVTVGFYLMFLSIMTSLFFKDEWVIRFSWILFSGVILQLLAGIVNLILLAPVWMQIIHLFLADFIWITLVLLFASIFSISTIKIDLAE
jgi:heme A synthase